MAPVFSDPMHSYKPAVPEDLTSFTVVSRSLGDTSLFADGLAKILLPGDVVLLIGDLGAGKTAFTKALASALGVEEPITSPTFTIMRTYDALLPLALLNPDIAATVGAEQGQLSARPVTLAHLDAYRLEHADAIEDLGLFELLDRGAIAVIEWGDLVAQAFDSAPLAIWITIEPASVEPVSVDQGGPCLVAASSSVGEEFADTAPRTIKCVAHRAGPWPSRLEALRTCLETLAPPNQIASIPKIHLDEMGI